MRKTFLVLFIFIGCGAAGCESLSPPVMRLSVGETFKSDVQGVQMSASRRCAFFFDKIDAGGTKHRVMVSEPPPDIAYNSITKFAADANYSLQKASGTTDVTQVVQQIGRAANATILRDALFRLDVAWANGAITSEDYARLYEKVISATIELAKIQGSVESGATSQRAGR